MRPIFTVHAGEYLVGSKIEGKFKKKFDLWIPARDTGLDLLVTNPTRHKMASLQVKFSKDFLGPGRQGDWHARIAAMGWWSLKRDEMRRSKASLWVLVTYTFATRARHFIVIPPRELLNRLTAIHGRKRLFHTYMWVTETGRCWEARGLPKKDQVLLAHDRLEDAHARDFTKHLNNWGLLKKLLS